MPALISHDFYHPAAPAWPMPAPGFSAKEKSAGYWSPAETNVKRPAKQAFCVFRKYGSQWDRRKAGFGGAPGGQWSSRAVNAVNASSFSL